MSGVEHDPFPAEQLNNLSGEGLADLQLDLNGARAVEVRVRGDGKVLWVNVDGLCRLRICNIENIEVADERSSRKKSGGFGSDLDKLSEFA